MVKWSPESMTKEERDAARRRHWEQYPELTVLAREMAARASEAIKRVVQLPPGEWNDNDWDWAFAWATSQNSASEVRYDLLRKLAGLVPWKLHTEPLKRALADYARTEGCTQREAKLRLLTNGIVLAYGDMDKPRTWRFGAQWEKDEHGHKVVAAPGEFKVEYSADFKRWLYKCACDYAERELLGGGRRSAPAMSLTRVSEAHHPSVPALNDVPAILDVMSWLEALPPGQRDVLLLEAVGYRDHDIAGARQISPGTVRVQVSQARKRLRKLREID